MSTLDKVRALFPTGAVVECVENTYIPRLNGSRRTITNARKSYAECEMDGKPFRMAFPERASDVLELTEDRVTFKLGNPAAAKGPHTCTLRLVAAEHLF